MRSFLSVLVSASLLCACRPAPGPAGPAAGIAFVSDRHGNWDVYLQQPDGAGLARLTGHPAADADPAWSPDGRQIAFRSRRAGSSDIFIMAADGGRPRNLIGDPAQSLDDEFNPAWRPGGQTLAIYADRLPPPQQCRAGAHPLALFPLDGDRDDIRLLGAVPGEQETFAWSPAGDPYHHTAPAWSPDGNFLAFVSNREGNSDVYVMEIATGEWTNLTRHPARDTSPTWSPVAENP